ncbi:DUF2946 family protein [Luteibacter sp.]|uniref:DUF2946 family protein n=1 Tax=Luteibacter sp. TaxID=1886636 RepID=UPI002D808C4E|nr:DUF2946 family protein [Luteibacter sp.]
MRHGLARNRWLGWMALVAVWLTVLAPSVSRTVSAAFVFPDLGTWCEPVPADHHGAARGHDADAPGDDAACGYCTLFAQMPALGTAFHIGHALPSPGYVAATLPAARAHEPTAILHAPPRGPPVAAHA